MGTVYETDPLILAGVKQSTGHTHTGHTDRENTPDTGTHTRTTRPPNEYLPQALNNAQRWRDDGACLSGVNILFFFSCVFSYFLCVCLRTTVGILLTARSYALCIGTVCETDPLILDGVNILFFFSCVFSYFLCMCLRITVGLTLRFLLFFFFSFFFFSVYVSSHHRRYFSHRTSLTQTTSKKRVNLSTPVG